MSWRNNFLFIAHRGASAYEPENTLVAFRKAVSMGADAIEFDVRRSKDGVPIVIHNGDLKRVVGVDKKVWELTVEELKSFKVFGREPIPVLEEVLAEFANKIPLFIEIKDEGLETKVVEYLNMYKSYDNVLIISFNYNILSKIKELLSKIDIGLITDRHPIPIREALKLRALAILPRYNLISSRIVSEMKSKNLKIYTWTINDVSTAMKIISYDVDGITTDNPSLKNDIRKQQKLFKYM